MWIEIKEDIFRGNDFKGLNYLIQLLTWFPNSSIQRYNLYVEYSIISTSKMYAQLHAIDREILEHEFEKYVIQSSTYSDLIKYSITDNNKYHNKNRLNIEEAIRFLSQPIAIILENSKNDACFIKAIILHLDETQLTKEYLENGWIQFENTGGCTNVENFIEGRLQSFNNLAEKNKKETAYYFRGMILLDSDKAYPTQKQKPQYKTLTTYLKHKKMDYHFLEKRMMENYMPDEVFQAISKRAVQEWITEYLKLSAEQKDFFNIQKGFPEEPIEPEIINLYSNISKKSLDILNQGFKYEDFKTNFPKFFVESSQVHKNTLKKRANSDELERILQKIKDLL